jgi:hypothetical protein
MINLHQETAHYNEENIDSTKLKLTEFRKKLYVTSELQQLKKTKKFKKRTDN